MIAFYYGSSHIPRKYRSQTVPVTLLATNLSLISRDVPRIANLPRVRMNYQRYSDYPGIIPFLQGGRVIHAAQYSPAQKEVMDRKETKTIRTATVKALIRIT